MHRLSKSQYMRGLQCHKSLWLFKFKHELREKPGPEQQAVFDSGTEVGILAQQLFPGGVNIEFDYYLCPICNDRIESYYKYAAKMY